MKIKQGQIVAITVGEWSDYALRDHLRAVRDFDTVDEGRRFTESADYLNEAGERYGSDDRFLTWAIREGLMEPLPTDTVVELWIGDYGRFEAPEPTERG